MARAVAALGMLALTFGVAETLRAMPGASAALGLALFGAALAPFLAAGPSPFAVGAGAVAAVAYALLRNGSPIAAASALTTIAFLPRALRAGAAPRVVLHVALAMLGGLAAGWVLAHGAREPLRIAFASMCAALPFALRVASPRVHRLLGFARASRGVARTRLLRAVALVRHAEEDFAVTGSDADPLGASVARLTRLAEARAGAGLEVASLDRALALQATAVRRALRALRVRWAARQAADGSPRDLDATTDLASAEAEVIEEIAR